MSTRANQKMALLKADLKLEFPAFYITESVVTTTNDPCLVLSAQDTPTHGNETAYIEIVPRSYDGFPTASLASTDDGRSHILKVATEQDAGGVTHWSTANYSKLIARLAHMNLEIDVYMSAHTVVPIHATVIDATKWIAEIRTDVRRQNSGD
jgi:hypothetical protein